MSHTIAQDEISIIDETASVPSANSNQVNISRLQQPDVSTIIDPSTVNLPVLKGIIVIVVPAYLLLIALLRHTYVHMCEHI